MVSLVWSFTWIMSKLLMASLFIYLLAIYFLAVCCNVWIGLVDYLIFRFMDCLTLSFLLLRFFLWSHLWLPILAVVCCFMSVLFLLVDYLSCRVMIISCDLLYISSKSSNPCLKFILLDNSDNTFCIIYFQSLSPSDSDNPFLHIL